MKLLKKVKDSIKEMPYSIPTDILLLILIMLGMLMMLIILLGAPLNTFSSVLLLLSDRTFKIASLMCIFRAMWMCIVTPFIGINRKLKIFRVSRSLFHPNRRWVSQRWIPKCNKECALNRLAADKRFLLQEIKNGKTYYFYSHDTIKNSMEKNGLTFIKCEKHHTKSLKEIRKILIKGIPFVKSKCKKCEDKYRNKCPLLTETQKEFYLMKVIYKG